MKPTQVFLLALAAFSAVEARGGGNKGNGGQNNAASSASNSTAASSTDSSSGSSSTCLASDALQKNSESSGQANEEAGQSPSATDQANFINFCSGKTITNGLQVKGGSCNGIVMGDIPSSTNMISSIITNPGPGDDLDANTPFNVTVQVQNLQAGTFTNPNTTYYGAPQALSGGKIVGHTHVTIQDLGGNIKTATPPDPATFTFFKGINDAGNGDGSLAAVVAAGLPAGTYRVCTMTSASNHQPVLMPVAQRGAQDDCTKFTVGGGGGGGGNGGKGGNQGGAGSAKQVSNADSGKNATASATESASASTSSAASGKAGNAGSGGRRFGGKGGRGKWRYMARDFIA